MSVFGTILCFSAVLAILVMLPAVVELVGLLVSAFTEWRDLRKEHKERKKRVVPKAEPNQKLVSYSEFHKKMETLVLPDSRIDRNQYYDFVTVAIGVNAQRFWDSFVEGMGFPKVYEVTLSPGESAVRIKFDLVQDTDLVDNRSNWGTTYIFVENSDNCYRMERVINDYKDKFETDYADMVVESILANARERRTEYRG